MNQQQFDADGDDEEFTDFRDNPIRKLFDNRPPGKYEKSFLDKEENMPNPATIRERDCRARYGERKQPKS